VRRRHSAGVVPLRPWRWGPSLDPTSEPTHSLLASDQPTRILLGFLLERSICSASPPVLGSRPGPLSSSVRKALLRRRSVDWAAWDVWAHRSAKALLRVVHILTLNRLRLSSALPLQGTERRAKCSWRWAFCQRSAASSPAQTQFEQGTTGPPTTLRCERALC
jgi:hypothetical protein